MEYVWDVINNKVLVIILHGASMVTVRAMGKERVINGWTGGALIKKIYLPTIDGINLQYVHLVQSPENKWIT